MKSADTRETIFALLFRRVGDSLLATPALRPEALLLEERQVGGRGRVRGGGQTRFLGV